MEVCPVGNEHCGIQCVPTGTCCQTGYESCRGDCVPVGTCNAGTGGSGSGGSGSGGSTGGTPPTGGRENVIIPVTCNDTGSGSGTLNSAYSGTSINAGSKSYYLQTNWWDHYDGQAINYTGLSFGINGSTRDAGNNNPAGFPSFFIGSYSGNTTSGSGLPRQISALSSVPTEIQTNLMNVDHSDFNATYDVWFTAGGSPLGSGQYNPGSGGAYLMVWLNRPTSRSPIGGVSGGAREVFGVEGTWNVFRSSTGGPGGLPIVSYVSAEPIAGLAFDLKAFIDDAVEIGILTSSQYLSIVFGGFEVWSGPSGISLNKFCVNVQ